MAEGRTATATAMATAVRPSPVVRRSARLVTAPAPSRERRRDAAAAPSVLERLWQTRALQPQLLVGAADDPFEREAEHTADAVMGGRPGPSQSLGAPAIASTILRAVQRALAKGEPPKKSDDDERKRVQKASAAAAGPGVVPAGVESQIATMGGGGRPLETSTRAFFEPRFGFDFGSVRTHTGPDAAGAALSLGARAFTVGDNIFFGAGEYRPETGAGRRLIAHELTHTIQQKPAAARAARLLAAPAQVQRGWLDDPKGAALAKVRQWADDLPPYELLTVILGRDPITDKGVDRNARNFLHAALKLVPDGMAIFADLEKNKTIEKVSQWFDAAVTKLNLTWDGIKGLFNQAWDSLDKLDFLQPSKVWDKVKAVFGPTLQRIADFAVEVGGKILEFLKKAVLEKLGAWAKEQRGYLLLTFVLGKDPVTDEEVKRTPKNFVKAVLDLVPGGDKIFENLEKSKTIEKTVAWLDTEITKLDLTWEKIKDLFKKAWDAFKVTDLLNPLGLIAKIAGIFLPPAKRVIDFAIAVGKKVLEFIFEGAMTIAGPMGLQIVAIAHKIGDTFNKIVEDPVGFVGNLIQALKKGFQQFGKNIWEHLKNGLIGWLVGALDGAGLVLPKVWDLKGIVSLVLQILGISYAKIRAKLVKIIGEERMAMLERVFGFIKTLVTEGPAAAWQQIVEAIGSLWDMVIGGIKDWAVTKIVTAAITKLATMFNPAGAIIQAIIATYNTVAFFIERIKQILALVESIVDSIANIAAGKLAAAANYVEQAMARTIPVILGFLARLIGLGNVSDAIKKVIIAIQEKVDKGIDAVIKWVVDKAKALFGGGKDKPDDPNGLPPASVKKSLTMAGESHTLSASVEGGHARVTMASGEDVELRELTKEALKSLEASPRPPDEKEFDRLMLLQIQEWATEKDLRASYNQAGKPQPFDAWLLKYVANIIDKNLLPLAQKGIPSLQEFFKKIPGKRFLPPAYRTGEWIRPNLYVSDAEWNNKRKSVTSRDKPIVGSQVDIANKTLNKALFDSLQIGPYDGKPGYKIPSSARLGKYTRSDYDSDSDMEIDHKTSLARHWATMLGNNTGDNPRHTIATDDGNLERVTGEYNRRKGGEGSNFSKVTWVESEFESSLGKSTKMSVKIKDLAFLRSDSGQPLVGK